jgi:hypothetical protein
MGRRDLGGGINETGMVIEGRSSLLVFDEKHPRPLGAPWLWGGKRGIVKIAGTLSRYSGRVSLTQIG